MDTNAKEVGMLKFGTVLTVFFYDLLHSSRGAVLGSVANGLDDLNFKKIERLPVGRTYGLCHPPLIDSDWNFRFAMIFFWGRISFIKTVVVMDSHRVCDKATAKMFAGPPHKLMADYSRTLASCRIEVHLSQYELFWDQSSSFSSATNKSKLLSALFNCSRPRKKGG